ncbi:MAG TPA: hypothetical protein VGG39_06900 [Polyangiaceae bacterium]|jgi:hypothetical protein
MKLAPALCLALTVSCAASIVACGSSGVVEYRGGGGGDPASAVAQKGTGSSGGNGDTGGSSGGATGSSSGGSPVGSSSGVAPGSSGGADGGSTAFGNVTVASFTLIDTGITTLPGGAPVSGFNPMAYGSTFDLAMVGYDLSMVVTPPQVSAVGSMAFALDATYTHTANTAPYSLCGDDGKGTFMKCPLAPGKHTLTVTVYPESDLQGAPYQPPTLFEFTVTDSSADMDAGDAAPE